jgi:hypothetical protein
MRQEERKEVVSGGLMHGGIDSCLVSCALTSKSLGGRRGWKGEEGGLGPDWR